MTNSEPINIVIDFSYLDLAAPTIDGSSYEDFYQLNYYCNSSVINSTSSQSGVYNTGQSNGSKATNQL